MASNPANCKLDLSTFGGVVYGKRQRLGLYNDVLGALGKSQFVKSGLSSMQLEQIHSFLVRPEKAATGTGTVRDVQVGTSDPLNQELTRIFIGSDAECRTDIVFAPDIDGQQKNAAHDCILGYARHPSDSTGRAVAERLQKVTPTSAGYGLLFLFKGKDSDGQEVLVLSRVPAEAGMVARETSQIMTVDFIERVFRKRSTAYKSALFKTFSLSAGFHLGRAVDRQTHAKVELAQYWINDFLECKLNLQDPLVPVAWALVWQKRSRTQTIQKRNRNCLP